MKQDDVVYINLAGTRGNVDLCGENDLSLRRNYFAM